MTTPERGSLLLEAMLAGAFMAIAAIGLSAAMVSGLSSGETSRRTLDRIATAENLIEQIRTTSQYDFTTAVTDFNAKSLTGESSVGFSGGDGSDAVSVTMPLDESVVPGSLDLNGDGKYGLLGTVVKASAARILVTDISGPDGLLLRSAVPNFAKLKGVSLDRDATEDAGPVEYGEVRTTTTQKTGNGNSTPPPPTFDETAPNTVTVSAASMVGRSARIVLLNSSTTARRIVSMTIAPNRAGVYFKSVALNGVTIFTPPSNVSSGTVTVGIASAQTFPSGEATLSIGDFYTRDAADRVIPVTPRDVTITCAYDDGSFTQTTVR